LSLNWKEINCILEELNLPGAQIQKVLQSTYDTLAFQVYGGCGTGDGGRGDGEHSTGDGDTGKGPARARLILVSLAPRGCRIHETFRAVPKSEKPLRFAEFLKARIVNGRIEEAVQLGDNRIVRITVRRGDKRYRLYIRLWSNAANVIAAEEDGTILDAMKRLPKRGEISGGLYRPEETMIPAAAGAPPGSPPSESTPAAELPPAHSTKQYEVRELPGDGSFNKRVDHRYAEQGGTRSLAELREEARRSIGKNRSRLEAALGRLREKEADYAGAERFKEYGDLVLSQGASIPEGAAWLEAETFAEAEGGRGGTIRIELDPRKGPAKNAEAYYEKYRKAKSGLGEIREEIAAGERELASLGEAETRLMEESNPLHLEGLIKKLRRGLLPSAAKMPSAIKAARGKSGGRMRPGLAFADGDWLFLVGRDAAENDELLRRHVNGSDLWLHVRDWAGSYVFIKNRPGKTVPLEILLDAGNLALFYSRGRNNRRGDLYYTQVKYLRRAKNGPRGLVIPTQEKNLAVTLDDGRLKRLEAARLMR
jgi:predicted ribosome quality control (RQC) complex YloA/Tae2 family protein